MVGWRPFTIYSEAKKGSNIEPEAVGVLIGRRVLEPGLTGCPGSFDLARLLSHVWTARRTLPHVHRFLAVERLRLDRHL